MWDTAVRDLQHAARGLLRNKAFTLVAVATLAIGIGAATAVFSVVDGVLLKRLPYPEADELVAVWHDAPGAPGLMAVAGGLQLSPSMLVTFQEENRSFEQIGLWATQTVNVTGLAERILSNQTRESLKQEVTEIQSAFERGGINQLLRTMERRARQPGANLYVIASPNGEILAGNVASLQPGVFDEEGWTNFPFRYQRYTDSGGVKRHLATGHVLGPFDLYGGFTDTELDGFRDHSTQVRRRLYTSYGYRLDNGTTLRLDVNYVRNEEDLPGALTREEFEARRAVLEYFRRLNAGDR